MGDITSTGNRIKEHTTMKISFRQALVGAVLLGSTAAGGALAASAIDSGSSSSAVVSAADDSGAVTTAAAEDVEASDGTDDATGTDATSTEDGDQDGDHHGRGRHGGPMGARTDETPLTGDILAKATAAAEAAVPGGTVERAENDADGGVYEVHMTKADGTHVTVQLDTNFAVTSIDEHQGGRGGHDGKGRHGDETPLTGDELAKVTAAAQAAVPGATLDRAETDAEGAAFEAHMTKADGTHVTVHFNADYTVADIETGH